MEGLFRLFVFAGHAGAGGNVRDMFSFYAIMSCKSFVRNQII